MTSIPASQDVSVIPGVLGTGGNPLAINSIFATQSARPPIGARGPVPVAFPSVSAVEDYFGVGSLEALVASVYFSGFTNCTQLPAKIFFGQYAQAAVAGYLRSGSFDGVTLAAIQAFNGTLILPIDGRTITTPSINLSSATSFSNAAALIQTGIRSAAASFAGTGAIATDVLTITVVTNGQLKIGDVITGANVTPTTTITSFIGGTGGLGTYGVTGADAASGSIDVAGPAAVVAFDSTLQEFTITSPTTGVNSAVGVATGTLSADMFFTTATGAITSLGSAAQTPGGFFAAMVAQTQNWAGITTIWEPTPTEQIAWAAAVNGASPAGAERFFYVGETTDITLTEGPAPSSFPVQTAAFNGRVAIFSQAPVTLADGTVVGDTYGKAAAFICGIAASTNWAAVRGRVTYKFRRNSQLVPSVVDATIAANLDGNGGQLANNGTSYFGAIATANQPFQYLRQGGISGDWDWIDEYVDQIYLNSQIQLALLSLLVQVNAIPYTQYGYGLVRAAMLAPINEALNNGSIVSGVILSPSQKAAVNTAVGNGVDAATVLFNQGWYLQILDPGAQARGLRATPAMTFWYTDGGAIQQINLASIDIQ